MLTLNRKIKLAALIIFVIILFTLYEDSILSVSNSDNPIVWTVSSLARTKLDEKPGNNRSIVLYAARGEYESFQIGISSHKNNLSNVNISVSDLVSQNNQIISKSNITLYREHYIEVRNSSPTVIASTNLPSGKGWYADALIPFVNPETQKDIKGAELDAVPFNVKSGQNQVIWVDIFVPRTAKAGEYKAVFTVTSDRTETRGEISLKVWDFVLPLKPSLKSAFAFKEEKYNKQSIIELLKHKFMPVLPSINMPIADERELIDKWGLTTLRLPFWSDATSKKCSIGSPPSVDEISKAVSQHQRELFLYVRYAHGLDKCPNLFSSVKKWSQAFHQVGIPVMMYVTPNPQLYDDGSGKGRSAVDIWIVQPKMYKRASERVSEVIAKGDQVWLDNPLMLDSYSPKLLLDFDPINFRIIHSFINQSLGFTGIFYWQIDLWTKNPWQDVEAYIDRKNRKYPGEGILVYPGKQVGINSVVPSMRLKWMRDGVEDYEYIEMMKKVSGKDAALKITRKVASDWDNWTRNPQVLESVRQEMGNQIERLSLAK
ncbi:hypothetical protein NIES2100_40470 [Calothrix sp. NIES-2100]|uniref:DUF4091 domain-containing protein n=1 Tax=Calothrix sp. NIES-2100 TaxID=1954172 RepID=UPI000B5EBE2F|nr:hypothetical protein NIES2100_40470 [Calothrix sp. NIES-2100]